MGKVAVEGHQMRGVAGGRTSQSRPLGRLRNLREVHERPEGFEEAAVMMVGLDFERVLRALPAVESQPRGNERLLRLLRLVADYAPTNVSDKVLEYALSYTDFVNRKVWHKV